MLTIFLSGTQTKYLRSVFFSVACYLGACSGIPVFAQDATKNADEVTVNNLRDLNSKQSDWGVATYHTGLVFSSDRGDGRKLYIQKQLNGEVSIFPLKIKTGYRIAAADFSADEKEVWFTLTRVFKRINGKKHTLKMNSGIYSARKDAQGNWSEPVPFRYNKASEYAVGDPFLSADGSTLYFVSDMPGGKGGMDIYYCEKTADGKWGQPVNAKEVNTEGNERTPSLDQEGNFYFSSDGRNGVGGLDIFSAKLSDDGFSMVQNLGSPVNSPQDDFAYRVTGIHAGFFSSNRSGGLGKEDIYRFTRQKITLKDINQ